MEYLRKLAFPKLTKSVFVQFRPRPKPNVAIMHPISRTSYGPNFIIIKLLPERLPDEITTII